MNNTKKPFYKKWWFIAIVVLLVIGAIGNGTKDKDAGKEVTKETPIKVETSGPTIEEDENPITIEDKVKNVVHEVTGEEAKKSDGKSRIVNVRSVEDVVAGNESKIIEIEMNADEHNTVARTRDVMLLSSAKLFPELFKESEISEIALSWNLPLEDAKGNSENKTVMKIRVHKDNDINWEKFDVYNFEKVADQYYEHKAIQVK